MKYLYNHTSEKTAVMVDDYPWGYRFRTQQRYWIETSKHGQRLATQTRNPKTGNWCKPKKSTYAFLMVLLENDKRHIKCTGISKYSAKEETINEFTKTHGDNLTPWQKTKCNELLAISRVMEHVTFTVKASEHGPVSLLSDKPEDVEKRRKIAEEQEEHKKEQAMVDRQINTAINHEFRQLEGGA